MVNVPGRSKGCLTCRQRKVKCDQTLPRCLQCFGMRLPCPGARTGTFFVHTVHAVPVRPPRMPTTPQALVGSCSGQELTSTVRENLDNPLDISPLSHIQPSRADPFDRLFVTHFTESFGNLKASAGGAPSAIWLDELPALVTSPLPSLVKHSIRAGSMFHYGMVAHDVSIQTEARRWYAKALQGLHSVLLLQGAGRGDYAISFNEGAICAAIMLSHFETVAGTSLGAWCQHVDGASMMLEMLGPERCRLAFMHQLFQHLRMLTFGAAMTRNKTHSFSSQPWIIIPFQVNPKTSFDLLVDVLFSLLPCLAVANKLRRSSGEEAAIFMTELCTLVQASVSLMDLWAKGIFRLGSSKAITHTFLAFADDATDSTACNSNPSRRIVYHDLPTAALSTQYDTANMIIFSLLLLISPLEDKYEGWIQQHAQSILSASKFINANPGPDSIRGSIMMLFPLRIVSLWSSSAYQRDEAARIIQSLSCNEQLNDVIPGGLYNDLATYIRYQRSTRCCQ